MTHCSALERRICPPELSSRHSSSQELAKNKVLLNKSRQSRPENADVMQRLMICWVVQSSVCKHMQSGGMMLLGIRTVVAWVFDGPDSRFQGNNHYVLQCFGTSPIRVDHSVYSMHSITYLKNVSSISILSKESYLPIGQHFSIDCKGRKSLKLQVFVNFTALHFAETASSAVNLSRAKFRKGTCHHNNWRLQGDFMQQSRSTRLATHKS